jgi:two-component system NtrC family sensor kinase
MKAATLPANEAQRVAALHSYGVLDSPCEVAIDALVEVASQVCQVPMAMVSLIDHNRQWLLSSIGLEGNQELPRELSFCTHAILDHAIMEVEDASADERFSDNPAVSGDMHVRFYAGMPLVDADGYALGTLCVIDRTPRRLTLTQTAVLRRLSAAVMKLLEGFRSEHAHRETERQNTLLRIAEEMADIGHFRIEPEANAVHFSPQIKRIFGWGVSDTPSLAAFLAAQHPTDRPSVEDALRAALEQGIPFDFESRVLRGETELRHVHAKCRCERDPETQRVHSVIGMIQDITERMHLRERLLHQERLVAAGTLAAGMGHEINNPLTYVAGNIDLARTRLARGTLDGAQQTELLGMLQEASEGVGRIRDIVRGLRVFARSDDSLVPSDVHASIRIAINIAMHELRQRASIETEFENIPTVLANEARLSQIFVNLIVNAAQAFATSDPSTNKIRLCTRSVPDGRVCIEVIDNGPGISRELLPRIFDPFFTTKPVGEGTGLGLAICHSLVSSLGGEIVCESQLGVGTEFRLLLPVSRRSVRPGERARANDIQPGPRGCVMIIDDESAIVRSMSHVLRDDHSVVAFTDPREASRELIARGDSFDLVLCDLMMPHLTGMELYRRLAESDPDTASRLVFMTGAAIDRSVQDFLATVPNERLEKPFGFEQLTQLVRRLVQKRAANAQV